MLCGRRDENVEGMGLCSSFLEILLAVPKSKTLYPGMNFRVLIPKGGGEGTVALFPALLTALFLKQTQVDTEQAGESQVQPAPSLLRNYHPPILAGYHSDGHFVSA